MSRTPDYVTTEQFSIIKNDFWDKLIIPVNTFVRPIELCYLPKHILDSSLHKWVDLNKEVYAYSHYGIIPIPKDKMRKV